jgi:hypothetical protein
MCLHWYPVFQSWQAHLGKCRTPQALDQTSGSWPGVTRLRFAPTLVFRSDLKAFQIPWPKPLSNPAPLHHLLNVARGVHSLTR